MGARPDPSTIGGEIGISSYVSENLSLIAGLAFLGSENFDDEMFGGANLGARFNLDKRLSPFLGFGAFVGYSKEEVPAEEDDIDNDDDGTVDEEGEKKKL